METYEEAKQAIDEARVIFRRLGRLKPKVRKTVLRFVQDMLESPPADEEAPRHASAVEPSLPLQGLAQTRRQEMARDPVIQPPAPGVSPAE